MFHNVLAVLKQRIVKALGHEDVAPEDAPQRRPLDFIDRVNEVVLGLVLHHRQLKLAHGFPDLYLQNHVLCLLLFKSVVQLNNVVAFLEACLIYQS